MDPNVFLELFGYLGTCLVLLSMMMTNLKKLRYFNICGSVISMIYSIFYNAWAVVFLNAGLIIINLIQLIRLKNSKRIFFHAKVQKDNPVLSYFIENNKEDIKKLFPSLTCGETTDLNVYLIFSQNEAVGVFAFDKNNQTARVLLDYTTPKYRDTQVGKYMYNQLKSEPITRLTSPKWSEAHIKYLKKVGFTEVNGLMEKSND